MDFNLEILPERVLLAPKNNAGVREPVIALVEVLKDGIGMVEELLQRLLVQQTGHTAGIGLINTDLRLKRQYGSGLQIESKLGYGTTVSFLVHQKQER